MAFHLHGAGKLTEASSIYVSAILQRNPGPSQCSTHYLGVAEAAGGKFDVAKSLMERSVRVQPRNPQFIENYASLLVQTGDCEAALPLCQSGLTLDPSNAQLLYVQAVALLRLNRLLEAITLNSTRSCCVSPTTSSR